MKSSNEETLEVFRLIIGRDEAEFEANGTISEYLIERGALYGNKLGRQKVTILQNDAAILYDYEAVGWKVMWYTTHSNAGKGDLTRSWISIRDKRHVAKD